MQRIAGRYPTSQDSLTENGLGSKTEPALLRQNAKLEQYRPKKKRKVEQTYQDEGKTH